MDEQSEQEMVNGMVHIILTESPELVSLRHITGNSVISLYVHGLNLLDLVQEIMIESWTKIMQMDFGLEEMPLMQIHDDDESKKLTLLMAPMLHCLMDNEIICVWSEMALSNMSMEMDDKHLPLELYRMRC